ncbi:MAG: hypothetical protein E7343_01310 [Clostridiales bacterium]|nr:hypothetical protein [Clostridiales bacterium]
MLNNILAVSPELQAQGYPKFIGIPEAALYALIGFCIVFLGIAFLIAIVYTVGKIINTRNGSDTKKETSATVKIENKPVVSSNESEEEISDETVAVITAAIMAYYEQTNPKCEFTVKRIKRF